MATIIQIKRSTSATAPTTGDLAEAELAYSQDKSNDGSGAILYIESVNNDDTPAIHKVGGKYYTDIVDTANSQSSASSLVQRDASGNFAANVITATEFIGSFSGSASSATIADTANTLTTARTITLAGDLEGDVSFDGSDDVTIYANVISNGIELGTDTTGDYVANVLAGTGIEVTDQGGEIANVTVALADTAVSPGTYGGASQVPSFVVDQQGRITQATNVSISTSITLGADSGSADQLDNGDTLRVLGGNAITTFVTDNTITVSADTSGVSADTYGGTSEIPVITVDVYGRITSAANASISTSFSLAGNTGTDTFSTGDTLFAVGGEGIVTAVTDNTFSIALTTTGVSGDTYGGTTNIPVLTVDNYGRISSAANVAISTTINLQGDYSGTGSVALGSDTLRFIGDTGIDANISGNTVTLLNTGVTTLYSGGHGLEVDQNEGDITINNTGVTAAFGGTGIGVDADTGNVTFTNLGVTSLSGTANEITVSAANGAVTIGLADPFQVDGDFTVTGNLTVVGNVTTISTVDLRVDDSLIYLAGNNYSSDVVDIGFIGNYYDGASQRHAGLARDASDGGKFKLFANVAGEPGSGVIDFTDVTYDIATVVASLTGGNVSGLASAIGVADGGTGKTSVTTNAILYGQGTSALAEATGTAGQVLQLNGSGVPVFGGLDGGTY